jgi:hypothetical protein
MPIRTPRIRALINGTVVDSIIHVDIAAKGSYKSSRFELTAYTDANVSGSQWLYTTNGMVLVEILMRPQQPDSEISMFQGLADNITLDPINHLIRIQGRDYSSVLTSSTYQDSFCNQTASEIASFIAGRHGFDSNISATSTMVGSYRSDGHNQIMLNSHSRTVTEWDLLTHLAKTEGFELFIDGQTLVFAPRNAIQTNYTAIDKSGASEIKFYKVCPLSSRTTLAIKSWNSWLSQSLLEASEQSSGQGETTALGPNDTAEREIAIIRPNLSSDDAVRLAQRYQDALNNNELNVEIVMPGELSLKPLDVLTVVGSDTSFDGDYVLTSVRRHFSSTGGFVQYIRGYSPGTASDLLPAAVGSLK